MAHVATDLEQILQTLDKLRPEEVELVAQQLAKLKAKNGPSLKPKTLLDDETFLIPFKEYAALSDEECDEIQLAAFEKYSAWIDFELARRRAKWILVCGGKVVDSSPRLDDYPSDEKMESVGKQLGYAPLVFIANPVIEESSWTALPDDDFYPSIKVTVGATACNKTELPEKGLTILADFDTGASGILFSYDHLRSNAIIQSQRYKRAQVRQHLGLIYHCYALPVQIATIDEAGEMASKITLALCVRNWQQSPLRIVNPFRKALVGRNLLLELSLRVELDGANRATKILAAP